MTDQQTQEANTAAPYKNKSARTALTLAIISYSVWALTALLFLLVSLAGSVETNGEGMTKAGGILVLGLLAMLMLAASAASSIANIGALIFGILGLRDAKRHDNAGYKAALTATIMSTVGVILTVIYAFTQAN